ncbi:glycosyltransferase family 2 protein [uncultured Polaribacter sp.]|uniref:glycosyltransferase family 2 protein n=1 Tax=uncultured Polaribacter sp. TaxID=174711 RepID=UPI002607EF7A|nr:glycosyltransferase family 2 protein [uncultured Polaribacter sp.]
MVSIIVPVYNCEEFLDECIQSVLDQTLNEWELILIDDYSTDSSKEIINKYVQFDKRIKTYSFDKNVGAGVSRNKGIQISEKRFIAFLDSDDYWHRDKLKKQLEFMINNDIEFSFTNFVELDKNDNPFKIILPPKEVSSFSLLFNNYIKTVTAIYDTKRIGKIYMPDYRKRQDWGLWFNILNKTNKAYCLFEPLAYYRTSNVSLSKDKFQLIKENFNFYRFFLHKSYVVSFIMMILFLTVHLSFKIIFFKKIKKLEDISF